MKKVNSALLALSLLCFLFFLSSTLFTANAKTIDMDGSFDDWDDVDVLVTDTIADYPYTGTIYYFNKDTNTWGTDVIANTCMYTQNRALDLGELRLTNDNDYLYILWKRGSDFLNYYWRDGTATEEMSFDDEAAIVYENNPCVGEIITAPVAFDHDLVLSVDTDSDDAFEYYLVIKVSFAQGAYSGYNTAGYIYEDNGNGTYTRSEETLAGTFGDSQYDVSPSGAAVMGAVLQEVKMDIGEVLNNLDLEWGDAVTVKYEAHSSAADDTDTADYTFEYTEEASSTSGDTNTFHKDSRCHAVTPQTPQWVRKYPAFGGVNLLWSAMGGDRVDVEIANGIGAYEYKYIKVSNTGHKFLPNVSFGQAVRVRVYNECEYGEWLSG